MADAARGHVHLNVSLADAASSTLHLGSFTFAAGPGDGFRGAVVVDTLGADGCVAVDGVTATRVGPMRGGNCSDPLAANYDAAASANATADCVYAGGRGLRQRAWSLMAPGYRDGAWAKPLETLNAYTAGEGTCDAPRNASLASGWKARMTDYDSKCGDQSYCCLSNDYWGCDATWDLADDDGFVEVARQDTLMGRAFEDQEWRRDAHDRSSENYAILDELEYMRTLSHGRIEMKLEWPDSGLDYMHWSQRMNPTQFNGRIRSEQYDEDLDYEAIHVPYFEADAWGGLEYDGDNALLDGSFNNDFWWYAVGSFGDTIPSTTGDGDAGDGCAAG